VKACINHGIMGEAEKLFPQPSAPSNELDWSSPVPDEDSSTRLIPLTRGMSAIVDTEDFERVSALTWHAVNTPKGSQWWYAEHRYKDGRVSRGFSLHRFILGVTDPAIKVDHRDGNGLNNSKTNLRSCTPAQNRANSRKQPNTTSRFKGVHRRKTETKFVAAIKIANKSKYLGAFENEEDAARAYDAAAKAHHGEFAKPNFPMETV